MITKKLWNTLSYKTRVELATVYKGTPVFPDYYHDFLNYNYEHDFGFDKSGQALKAILECCRLQSDGTIDVITTVKPTYGGITKSKEQEVRDKKKQAKQQQVIKHYEEPERCTWYVDYEYPINHNDPDSECDVAHAWYNAYSKEDARRQFEHDYWDYCRIIRISKYE